MSHNITFITASLKTLIKQRVIINLRKLKLCIAFSEGPFSVPINFHMLPFQIIVVIVVKYPLHFCCFHLVFSLPCASRFSCFDCLFHNLRWHSFWRFPLVDSLIPTFLCKVLHQSQKLFKWVFTKCLVLLQQMLSLSVLQFCVLLTCSLLAWSLAPGHFMLLPFF